MRTLLQARKHMKISLRKLAAASGVPFNRIHAIENRLRPASPDERLRLESVLGHLLWPPPPAPPPQLALSLRRSLGTRKRYRAPRDRESVIRLREAQRLYPGLTRGLLAGPRDEWFVANVVADSHLEMIAWLKLLKLGSSTRVAPLAVGFRALPVVDPRSRACVGDCPVPAVHGMHEDLFWLIVPQVTLLTSAGLRRVDGLLGVSQGGGARWLALEIDGSGHSPHRDADRARELNMEVLRFQDSQVLKPDFTTLFISAVRSQI